MMGLIAPVLSKLPEPTAAILNTDGPLGKESKTVRTFKPVTESEKPLVYTIVIVCTGRSTGYLIAPFLIHFMVLSHSP